MPREVNDTQPFADKLVKLIPTEIVGAYMVLAGIIGFSPTSNSVPTDGMARTLIQVVFFILLILTPIYLRMVTGVSNLVQIIVTSISFIVWVYTLGGPFVVWKIFYPLVSSVVLVLWSLVTPLLVKSADSKVPVSPPDAAPAGNQ